MIAQAEKFEVYGIKLNGKLTNGENIADLGGLRLSYRALCKSLPENSPLINGFSPQQRFFIAWSQCWRQNIKEERAKQLVTLDPHGPNEWRANSPLQNMHEFYEAFGVGPEDKMYRPEQDRVLIW
jgi:putative endopeptidase